MATFSALPLPPSVPFTSLPSFSSVSSSSSSSPSSQLLFRDSPPPSNERSYTKKTPMALCESSSILDNLAEKLLLVNLHNDPWKMLSKAAMSNLRSERYPAVQKVRRFLASSPPPIEDVIRSGVVPFLVKYLYEEEDGALQYEASWALTNIAAGEAEHTKAVVEAGAIPPLLALIEGRRRRRKMTGLAVSESDTEEEEEEEGGGGEVDGLLLSEIRRRRRRERRRIKTTEEEESEELTRWQAMWCIGNIAGDGAGSRDCILEHENSENAIMQYIRTANRLPTIRTGIWALANLCRWRKSSKKLAEFLVKIANIMTEALRRNPDDAEIVCDATWCLYYISRKMNGVCDVLQSGAARFLSELIMHPTPLIQKAALHCIGQIASGTNEQTQYLFDVGIIEKLLCFVLPDYFDRMKSVQCRREGGEYGNTEGGGGGRSLSVSYHHHHHCQVTCSRCFKNQYKYCGFLEGEGGGGGATVTEEEEWRRKNQILQKQEEWICDECCCCSNESNTVFGDSNRNNSSNSCSLLNSSSNSCCGVGTRLRPLSLSSSVGCNNNAYSSSFSSSVSVSSSFPFSSVSSSPTPFKSRSSTFSSSSSFSAASDSRYTACWILSNLALGTQCQIQTLLNSDAISVMLELLNHHQEEERVKKEVAWALVSATKGACPKQVEEFIALGVDEIIYNILDNFDLSEVMAVEAVLKALENILEVGSTKVKSENIFFNPFAEKARKFGVVDKLLFLKNCGFSETTTRILTKFF